MNQNHENPFLFPFAKTWRCRWIGQLCLFIALLLIACLANAQTAPDVTFTISAVSQGPGIAAPTLTWSSTTPAPASCAASGDWSGVKTASGTLVLPAVTTNKNYVLACTFTADTQAIVSWEAPTTNTDGTALTDLAGFKVYWNSGDPSMVTAPTGKVRAITNGTTLTTTITGLTAGNWYFAVTALKASGVESGISNVATKAIGTNAVVTKSAALVFPGTVVVTVR